MPTKPITISNLQLITETKSANLSVAAVVGDTTLTVYTISPFAINQIILIGEFGEEDSEIIDTHASTAPSGTTITLASSLVKNHPQDVRVYVLTYDEIELSTADTIAGTKTVLETDDIDPERTNTLFTDSTTVSGYYFTRFYNSIIAAYSDYSDPLPVAGFPSNTVGFIIDLAMKESNREYTEKLTYDVLVSEINSCLRFIKGKLKKWSNFEKYDYVVGQLTRGQYLWSLPADYYDPNSNRSMLDVRVGTSDVLTYIDKQEVVNFLQDIPHTTVATAANIGDITLDLTSAADFNTSGSVDIYISNQVYNVTYTGVSGNTLTGIPDSGSGSITLPISATTNVWFNEMEGTPQYFSVFNGQLALLPITSDTTAGQNIYMDYNTDLTEVDSDSDVIPYTRFDMIKHWLMWIIRAITERNGKKELSDPDYVMFSQILADAVRRESSGQKYKMKPKVSGIDYSRVVNQTYDEYLRT